MSSTILSFQRKEYLGLSTIKFVVYFSMPGISTPVPVEIIFLLMKKFLIGWMKIQYKQSKKVSKMIFGLTCTELYDKIKINTTL